MGRRRGVSGGEPGRRWLVIAALALAGVCDSLHAHATPLTGRAGPGQWVARLSDPDPAVRRGALWLLGRHALRQDSATSSPALEALRDLVPRETDRSVLLTAVAVLAVNRPEGARVALASLVQAGAAGAWPPVEVSAAAARALGTQGDPDAVPALLTAAARVGVTGEAAARALADLPDEAFSQALTRARRSSSELGGVVRAVGWRGDPRWGGVVLEALRSSSQTVALAGIEATARLRLAEAAVLLADLAHGAESPVVRRAATRALGSVGGAVDPGVLRERLADPATREAALEATAALGAPELVPAVTPLLAAPWVVDRRQAAEALGAIGDAGAVGALAARARREPDAAARSAMWHATARVGGARARAALDAALDDPAARWARVELAWREGRPPGGARVPGDDASARVLRALAGGGADAAALAAGDADARLAAALALGAAGDGAAALATRLWREDDEGVRVALVLGLARANGDVAEGALRLLLEREADAPSLAAVAAADAVGRRGMTALAPVLRRIARAPDAVARAVAARSLGVLGDRAARPTLEALAVFETDPQARGAAALGLAAVAGPGADAALRAVEATAWTARLEEMARRARGIARGSAPPAPFEGAGVARLVGAPPRSVWAVALPDGGWALGVAAGDGEVLIPGAPSADSPLRRLDVGRDEE